ncbi:oleandomycin transport system ATP-binding protein [Haloactinospora alba]|uniref:Oleandomycin transport system ATP-binding protein n=1 Tax=Haloactinospora alba TaxID=405555 RepID=A0A543NHX2_9ACTN|nr:ATP-binding cassette domain-containing protein [Haloactinospora alba]TQN31442.1 oleandomycin transport system ATP-binding protein [Haloactinospora alba]
MTDAIRAEGLVKRFNGETALAGVDLTVRTGTVMGILGPNGSGKTTTVRILSTLLRPDAGHAVVGGYDVSTQPHHVRRLIGLTGQYAAVDEDLTGTQNLVLIARLLGYSRRGSHQRASQLLERFALTDAADRPAKTYSGGMRRRLDLAASLVGRPSLLYLDEPTTGLDPHSRNEMWEVVRGLLDDGVTVLLTTQYLEEADQLADDLVVLDHGRVISEGSPEKLKERAGTQVLQVQPEEGAQLDRVASIVHEVTGTDVRSSETAVHASVTEPNVLPQVVRRLDEEGIAVGELTLRKPSLDEVFLAITGHAAASGPDSDSTDATPEGTTV